MTSNPCRGPTPDAQARAPVTRGDLGRFLRSWTANPLRVAAIAPSGQKLARLMVQEITPQMGPILELGPGTGVFTRALLTQGIAEADLTLVELDPGFAALLRQRFSHAHVVVGSAADISRADLIHGRRVGAVVSGLGLLSMPLNTVRAILAGAFDCLKPDGAFYQFTYGPACPVPNSVLDDLKLGAQRIGGTWANLPPAAVYRIVRLDKDMKELPTTERRSNELDS